jgi:hypothetical protein
MGTILVSYGIEKELMLSMKSFSFSLNPFES